MPDAAVDAGADDAGVTADAGDVDAGPQDVDAGDVDAGSPELDAGVDAGAGDAGVDAGLDAGVDAGAPDAGRTARDCFATEYLNPTDGGGPDYDQFHPVVGSHCRGTNHQAITGVQRVVFLGDSVTVGTPPTNLNPANVYRALLSQRLATLFSLPPPGTGWGGANPFSGLALPAESGAFSSCSEWGAHTSDLPGSGKQVESCFPSNKRNLRTLVVMTMGGNDVSTLTKEGGGTMPQKTIPQLRADAQVVVDKLREAIVWMKNPANVPGGVDVVFSNNYEFTDGTGNVASCSSASLSGIEPWQDRQAQKELVVWLEEQYLKVAVDTQTDMIFMLESFCGHGYERNNPAALCYRGPNQALWFDATCIHPSDVGHAALADLFYRTIAE
jgi:lysophospholipase L1-like esterase